VNTAFPRMSDGLCCSQQSCMFFYSWYFCDYLTLI
jgi:hypothetical protein